VSVVSRKQRRNAVAASRVYRGILGAAKSIERRGKGALRCVSLA
jgi:hypothetical protein